MARTKGSKNKKTVGKENVEPVKKDIIKPTKKQCNKIIDVKMKNKKRTFLNFLIRQHYLEGA